MKDSTLGAHDYPEETRDWMLLSCQGLQAAYRDAEPEYSLDAIKELNPDYEQ